MLIVVFVPGDEYWGTPSETEIYDLSNFQDYTKTGFENFLWCMNGWDIEGIYESKDKLPEHLRRESKDITWYAWDRETEDFVKLPHDIETIQRECFHEWGGTTKEYGGVGYTDITWTRKCEKCGKSESTTKAREDTFTRITPIF